MSSFKIDCENFSKHMLPELTIKIIGYYSIDGDSQYHADLSQMKYYIPPPDLNNVSFDLNKDFMFTIYKPTSYIRLDDVLRWVSDNFNLLEKPLSHQQGQWLNTDFICRRAALKTLLCTPYNKSNQNWIICACKYRDTIYLCEFYTDEREHQYVNSTAKERQLTSHGFKFEQFMVADHPSNKPNTSVPLNECEKFYCMIKADFGNHSLLYAAEIDGISSEQPIMDILADTTFELIELKTIPMKFYNEIGTVLHNKYGLIPVNKAITYWSQNYLAGIKRLICGIKDNYGQVKMIKEFPTHNLSQFSKPCGNVDKCKMFCKIFLDNVKKIVIKDYNECMYKFYFDASKNVINYSEEAPDNKTYLFLKTWFVEKAENYNNTSQ